MPRRLREYLDRLTHRDTHREESSVHIVNTAVNLNDWQPVRWNATQWFPDNEDTPARVYHHDMDDPTAEVFPGRTVRPSEALRRMWEENMTAREVEEIASTTPEDMLRMVRVVPNIDYYNLVEERPMDPPEPQRHPLYIHDMDDTTMYREYTPYWNSNRTISWNWSNKLGGHVEFRRGRIIRVKRYCKI